MTESHSPMYYTELEPEPDLKPWIAAYWHFRVEPDAGEIDHWIPLTGGVMLACHKDAPAIITGPRIEPFGTRVRGGEIYWGAHLWPGAAESLLGPRARGLRGLQRLASEVVSREWAGAIARALEDETHESTATETLDAAFLELAGCTSAIDEAMMAAVMRVIAAGGKLALTDLAAGVHLSPRHLRRRFRAATELTPKEFARLQRLRSSAVEAVQHERPRWVDVATESGYSDQAHLVREYRRILGLTPAAFGSHAGCIRHGRIIR